MRSKGIRDRWMFNGILMVTMIVAFAIMAFSLAMYNYYSTAVRTGLENKAQTAVEFFTSYVSKTYLEYYQSAYHYTETFQDKDSLELQFINSRGKVEVSSYGISAGSSLGTPDVKEALDRGIICSWKGRNPATGERILSVSAPMRYSDGSTVGVMRYVTSMKLVNKQAIQVTAMAMAMGLLIVISVFISNNYFISTITVPIQNLTAVAKRIAEGSYGIQTEKKYDDEIGELIDAINEMSAKISQAEAVQTEFVSSVSHELRTPLTAITGWSETLMYDTEIKGDSRRGLSIISKEAARLTEMVEELLEFTRIQDGRFNLRIETMDLQTELEDTLFAYSEALKQESMAISYSPPELELMPVNADPQRLRQVFLNILDNAAKYGKAGGMIDVSLEKKGDFAHVTFRDYGPGIPENELPRVKEKFYKGSSRERGSGIGLAVCDEIVNRHGGELTVENAQGGGVLVTVKLPMGGI